MNLSFPVLIFHYPFHYPLIYRQKKGAENHQPPFFVNLILLQSFYINRCRAFFALFDIKTDPLAFGQGPKTLHGDGGMMDKNILFLTIYLDEAETFVFIEPLYASFCHSRILLFPYFSSWDTTKKKASWLEALMPKLSRFPPTSTASLSLKGG
jgi:hypothetical protein